MISPDLLTSCLSPRAWRSSGVSIRVAQSSEAGAKGCGIEIQEQTRGVSREFQIGDDLRLMDRMEALDSLQFDDDGVLDEQVENEPAPDRLPLVGESNRMAALGLELVPSQFDEQAFAIHRFQKPRSQYTMDLDRASNETCDRFFSSGLL